MKHSLSVTLILVAIFLLSHLVGLLVLSEYRIVSDSGLVWRELPSVAGQRFERPEMGSSSLVISLIAGVLLGTVLILFFVRRQNVWLWRVLFFFSVALCLYVSLFAFLSEVWSFFIAFFAAGLKIFRPSVILHNATEVFVYSGLAAIFVPVLTLPSVSILLIIISVYDAYAVWKSQHMIVLAKFQMKAKLFAGLLVPYKLSQSVRRGRSKEKVNTAVLGGGDIAFPLLFSGVIFTSIGFWQALFVSFITSIALFLLMYTGQKDRFYPAMPFLSMGCFVGYGLVVVSGWLV